MRGTLPWRMRLLSALTPQPDWDSITPDQLVELRQAQQRTLLSPIGKLVNGRPARRARISTHTLDLPGRRLSVRVYRPEHADNALPLVIAFHGGGFISGEPRQDDWLLSHLAAHSPAVVASLDYRLAPEHPIPAAVRDAHQAAPLLADRAAEWGAEPSRIVLLGSSAGATLAALTAISADDLGLSVRAQVLLNPQLDCTTGAFEYPSFTENAESPTATPANCRAALRIALPASFDAREISPIHIADLAGLAPALIVSAGLDTLEDQSSAYAERLRRADVEVTLRRYPRATHSFLSMPGLVPAAKPARAEILAFLRDQVPVQAPKASRS